jgi:tryptophan synthase alpha chain
LLVGFGISTPEQAAQGAAVADGVVVGSAAIAAAERGGPSGLADFVGSLRRAIDRVSSPLPA